MKMVMLLLVFAVTQLVSPAVVHHHSLRKSIFDQVESCTASYTRTGKEDELFVEDLSHLSSGKDMCGDKFFCKAHDVLNKTENFCGNQEALVRTLRSYNTGRNVICENTLQGMNSTGTQRNVSKLLENIKKCVQHLNFNTHTNNGSG